jgi:uncharacterized protein YciI
MNFDQHTMALLILRKDRPKLSEEEENKLQDAHLAHLAKLHDMGILLMAGPTIGPADREIRGLSLYRGLIEEVKRLADEDPAVKAGKYTHQFIPWIVPSGAASFKHTIFPRSLRDAQ